MPNENIKVLKVDGRDFTIRWRGFFDRPTFPGVQTKGWVYTGTINEFRLPHVHQTVEKLLFCAFEIAKHSFEHPEWMFNNLGRPLDLEVFLA
jgi:hypothetical protein